MTIPKEGARWRASDGTVYVAENVTDLTQEDDFTPGDDRFAIELTTEAGVTDFSEAGFDLLEEEFAEFIAERGLKPI